MARALPAVALLVSLLASVQAGAQVPPRTGEAAPAAEGAEGGARVREWVQKGAQKVVEIDFDESSADKIYGKVQKPGVDYLITQGDLAYEGIPMERDLVRTLEESLEKPPF